MCMLCSDISGVFRPLDPFPLRGSLPTLFQHQQTDEIRQNVATFEANPGLPRDTLTGYSSHEQSSPAGLLLE